MPIVKFTSNLKRFYPELAPYQVNSTDLTEILDELNKKYPKIKDYIVDEQNQLRRHVNIFINNVMIEDRQGLTDKLSEDAEIYIFQALSGG